MRKKIFTIFIIVGILFLFYLLNLPSVYYNLKDFASNPERIKEYILGYGALGPVIIIIIQVIQVVISPIPGMITSLAGGALYGVFWGFLLNTFGIFLGSLVAFYLAKTFGKPLVIRIIGRKSYDKYSKLVSEKYTIGLFILFVLPFFPDDALCLLAGISGMNLSIFIFFVLVGRSPGLFIATLVGSGIITLSLPMWIFFGLLSLAIVYFSIKYNKDIENYIISKVEKYKKKQRGRFFLLHKRRK